MCAGILLWCSCLVHDSNSLRYCITISCQERILSYYLTIKLQMNDNLKKIYLNNWATCEAFFWLYNNYAFILPLESYIHCLFTCYKIQFVLTLVNWLCMLISLVMSQRDDASDTGQLIEHADFSGDITKRQCFSSDYFQSRIIILTVLQLNCYQS